MNVVMRYAKDKKSDEDYLRFLINYRLDLLTKYTRTGIYVRLNRYENFCPKQILFLSDSGMTKCKEKCAEGIFTPCEECWTQLLEKLESYVDIKKNLPIFLQKNNKSRPSFLKR